MAYGHELREGGHSEGWGGLNRLAQPTQGSGLKRQMSKQERGLPDLTEVIVKQERHMLTAETQICQEWQRMLQSQQPGS